MMRLFMYRDGLGFYWRTHIEPTSVEDCKHTSEIEEQIYALLFGWA